MNYQYLSLSPAEHFRVHGTLPTNAIEDLLEAVKSADVLDDIEAHIEEARGCFLEEDFGQRTKDRLHDLAKRLRGDNKLEVLAILEELTEDIDQEVKSGEYGYDEFKKALGAIENARR